MLRILLGSLLLLLAGCSDRQGSQVSETAVLEIWAHAGQASERQVLEQQVKRFNTSQGDVKAHLTFIPERTYNAQVQAAAVADALPDLLEFDGPFLYNYIWQGHLIPLDGLLSTRTHEGLLPSIIKQGSYRGKLYAVGAYDSGLGIYARRSRLENAGLRVPATPEEAWTKDEFDAVLKTLASQDPDGRVLDLKLNYSGEWFTYAFSPLLQSAGGDLVDRHDYQAAGGVLDGPESVAAMETLSDWFRSGTVDPNVDDAAFVDGRVGLSWAGHWEYSRYALAVGDDLLVLPLPDLGHGSRTGQGSWAWGVAKGCSNPQAAGRFIDFLLAAEEVLAMTSANGAVPATLAAIERSPLYADNGPLHLFTRQLQGGFSMPRPQTPAYPVITSAFQQAFSDIRNGGDVQTALNKAAALIDQDIRDNKGYPSN